MNKGLVFIFLCLLGFILGLKQSRSLNSENVALQIEYLGTCKQFMDKDLSSVRISSHSAGNCLPLVQGGASIPFKGEFNDPDIVYRDLNDLESDYFCTDMEGPKALIHFVEVYQNGNPNTPITDFILSFVSSAPFRAKSSDIVYTRRPSCETDKLFCPPYTETVTNCTPNVIQFGAILEKGKNFIDNAYVITRDRIYLSTSKNAPALCDDGVTCCSYIASRANGGMCAYQTGEFVLPFLEDYELHSTLNTEEHRDFLKKHPHVKQVFKHKKVSQKDERKPLQVKQPVQQKHAVEGKINSSVTMNRHSPSAKSSVNVPDVKDAKQMYHHTAKKN